MPILVDWETLTILEEPEDDGLAKQLADENKVYEAMGFMEPEGTTETNREDVHIPGMSAEMHADMAEAAIDVDDIVDAEPLCEWDRDNPDQMHWTLG